MRSLLWFLLLISFSGHAQETLQGKIFKNDTVAVNVHVQNVTTGKYAVSTEQGLFSLLSKPGDTLLFSHVGAAYLVKILTPQDLLENPLVIKLSENENELDEVIINEHSDINAVSLGIIPKKVKKLSVNERRLKTAGDFKPKSLLGLLFGGIKLDPILNAINGRTKNLKQNIAAEQKLKNLAFLENNFYDYLQKEMTLTDQEIKMFLRYAVEESSLQALIDNKNDAAIMFFLHDTWFKFQQERS